MLKKEVGFASGDICDESEEENAFAEFAASQTAAEGNGS